MESIFENTTTLTRQNLTEMARATVPAAREETTQGKRPPPFGILPGGASVCGPGFCCWRPLLWL